MDLCCFLTDTFSSISIVHTEIHISSLRGLVFVSSFDRIKLEKALLMIILLLFKFNHSLFIFYSKIFWSNFKINVCQKQGVRRTTTTLGAPG